MYIEIVMSIIVRTLCKFCLLKMMPSTSVLQLIIVKNHKTNATNDDDNKRSRTDGWHTFAFMHRSSSTTLSYGAVVLVQSRKTLAIIGNENKESESSETLISSLI